MSDIAAAERAVLQEEHRAADSKTLFGFWAYIMTDCLLFASLFATYAVLHGNTVGGPSGRDIFSLPYILVETLALLTSSFTCGLAMLAANRHAKRQALGWLAVTFVFGLIFLLMELTEFGRLAHDGNSWQRSGFLSSYFTLVGTHGLHITVGLLWMAALVAKVWSSGFSRANLRRLTMFSLFWHFLDIVWIFIFTVVYMLGAV
ncbi:MAG TPA: cytochrome o ubiquinol oxidase subunit III [Candidatus Saccharimonadales bacterium]|nr:cytochrome o ubiquinol oxidase subunit III [Candidatus Saccharimonadales bacterium]